MSRAGWELTTLGQYCEVFSGYPFKSIGFTDDPNDIPLVKGENIGQGEVLWDISKRWPIQDLAELERYKLIKGDVVLAMDRPWVPAGLKFAKITASAPDALLVQRVARLRGLKGLDQSFLAQLIASPSFVGYVQSVGRGVGVPHISSKEIGAFTFWLPPLMEQEKIGNTLSAYDDLIDNNRRRMALLEDSARQLYREWFVRLRFPGHEHTPIVDGVPQGWERAPLESALVLQRGFDLPTQDRQDGEVPIYGSTGILGHHNQAKAAAPGVVTGRSGTLGEVQYVDQDYWPLNTALWVKGFKRVTPLFALFLLREMDLKQFNGGASVPTLDRKSVHRVDVLIPSTQMLRAFDEFAVDVFAQVKKLASQNQKLRQARDLLLPRLMNGELAV
ncbi:restriction endonuclease subunit S [Limnohabitans sp. DM1]|uniref:restriction endonuclease subunit S n=1 Tax=Limnohabitans sp. DM1 TaxID=1597955 RepID=UPI000B3336B5|nr:restriction endonuclease subunit S [Limnohabitans sp. DM1]